MSALLEAQKINERSDKRVQTILTENKSWGTTYKSLVALLDGKNAKNAAIAKKTLMIMDNQARMMEVIKRDPRLESTFSQNLGALVPKVVDLVRIFYPNLVANELVDIQPMDRQNGEVFIIKPQYSNTAAGVVAGNQVFSTVTDGTYASEAVTFTVGTGNASAVTFNAGLVPTPVRPGTVRVVSGTVSGNDALNVQGSGTGTITGTGISSGTISYTTGALAVTFAVAPGNGVAVTATFRYDSEQSPSNHRSLDIQLSLVPITAEPHPLNVRWSQQAALAASAHLDLDLEKTLTDLIASFIRQERDILLINGIVAAAAGDTSLDFDAAAPANYSKLAKYAEIELKLNYAESSIQAALGRGGISWVLAGNNASDLWRNCNGFVPSDVIAPVGPHKIGTLRDGTVSVIKVPSMNTNTYVVGFKGYVVGDAATILAEWVPLYASPVFQSYDLNNYQGMMSLYTIVMNNTAYYKKGTISNYAA